MGDILKYVMINKTTNEIKQALTDKGLSVDSSITLKDLHN